MSEATNGQAELAAMGDDIAALKRDFASLMEHLKSGGRGTAEDAMERLSEGTQRIYDSLAAEGERSVKTISRHVEEQPLTTLLVAFGIGLIGGRLLSR